jgi:hypothetical protein
LGRSEIRARGTCQCAVASDLPRQYLSLPAGSVARRARTTLPPQVRALQSNRYWQENSRDRAEDEQRACWPCEPVGGAVSGSRARCSQSSRVATGRRMVLARQRRVVPVVVLPARSVPGGCSVDARRGSVLSVIGAQRLTSRMR